MLLRPMLCRSSEMKPASMSASIIGSRATLTRAPKRRSGEEWKLKNEVQVAEGFVDQVNGEPELPEENY